MLNLSLAGTVGRDAEYKESQNSRGRCQFSVAVNVGYGENKSTVWVDVTRWGEGSRGLSNHLTKGTKVAVSGEMSTREHNGKTYIQCRADNVTLMGSYAGGASKERVPASADTPIDLDDEIPF